MTKHKWYKEIIAWAEGEQIQYRKKGAVKWRDEPDELPCWDSIIFDYRIKPQQKKLEYLYLCLNDEGELLFEAEKDTYAIDNDFVTYIGKIKLEVDDD